MGSDTAGGSPHSLRGERRSRAGPAWVRVGPRSGLQRPLAGGSRAAPMGGGTQQPQTPRLPLLEPAGGTRPPRPSLHFACPDTWIEAAGPAAELPVLPAPRYPSPCARPCPPGQLSGGSACGPISRRPFPSDSAGRAVSARSPASGSRAERGWQWLRRCAAQGGSAEATRMAPAASGVSGTPGGPRPLSGSQFSCP